MKAADFHALFRATGEAELAPLGFVYKARAWHHATDEIQLSLCPEDTKFGIGFALKYLTLALWHKSVDVPPSFTFEPFKNNSWICPVRISPAVVCRLVESGFDPEVWDCPAPGLRRRATHLPVYFGGPEFWVLADTSAPLHENQQALLHALEGDGIEDLSEEVTKAAVTRAFAAVARCGLAWAEHTTIVETYRLMNRHPPDGSTLVFDSWFPSYRAAAESNPS